MRNCLRNYLWFFDVFNEYRNGTWREMSSRIYSGFLTFSGGMEMKHWREMG